MATTEPLLSVRELSVEFTMGSQRATAVQRVSFSMDRGEVLALVGESGSGKSVTAMAALGLLPSGARIDGSIRFAGTDLLRLRGERLREVRGRRIAMIFQEPMTALNPVHTVGRQLVEAIRCHDPVSKRAARQRAVELLAKVGIPHPERRLGSYPHQLSGGQRQRVMIAMAVSSSPELLVADEPTTALDVTVQAEILALLRQLQRDLGLAVLLITHDMGVVADLADRVVVMRRGVVVEEAPVGTLFQAPQHEYTRKLLAAVPRPDATAADPGDRPDDGTAEPALRVRDLYIDYPGPLGRKGFTAVHGISLDIAKGAVLGLVGESGSGKSTIGRAIVGLLPARSGSIEVAGHRLGELRGRRLRQLRTRFSMVFQDPGSSLNPRLTIGAAIAAPMVINRYAEPAAIRRRVRELLELLELPAAWADRYPHELSGGQRQRVGIARALALEPELLIADEPTSALDVSVQATVLRLFRQLQERLGFSCLFISHDLGVVEMLSDHIAVLQNGRLVETGPAATVLRDPRTDYTRRLIAAAPVADPARQAVRRARWEAMAG